MSNQSNIIASLVIVIVLVGTLLAGAITQMYAAVEPESPTPNIGWWKLDETTGTIAYDSSGNEFHGNINGAPQQSQSIFQDITGYRFSGSGQNIIIPDEPEFHLVEGPMSMAVWLTSDAKDGIGHNLFTHGNWFINQRATNQITCAVDVGGGMFVRAILEPVDWEINTPIQLTCTWDGDKIVLYKNSVFYTETSVPTSQVDQNIDLKIGGDDVSGQYWHGLVGDVRLYDYILADNEISGIFLDAKQFNRATMSLWTLLPILALLGITVALVTQTWKVKE